MSTAVATYLDPAEAYESVKEVIDITVKGFVRRYGGSYDDLRADANTFWMRAHDAWVAGTANSDNYATNTRRWVWYQLFDELRVKARWRHKTQIKVVGGDSTLRLATKDSTLRLCHFIEDLGEDAAIAARLVIDTPEELRRVFAAKGGEPRNFRSSLRDYLKALGWTAARINESFNEIKEALKS